MPWVFALVGVPLYALVLVVALSPALVADVGLDLSPIEVEGTLLTVLIFLGVQEAWFVAMTPVKQAQQGRAEGQPTSQAGSQPSTSSARREAGPT